MDYVITWKSKEAYTSKLKLFYATFLNSIHLFGYRMGIKFDKDPLPVEQNNYLTKIVNTFRCLARKSYYKFQN